MSFNLLKDGGILLFDDYEWSDAYMIDQMYDNSKLFQDEGVTHTRALSSFESYFTPSHAINSFLNIYKHDIEVIFKKYQVAIRKIGSRSCKSLRRGTKAFSP